MEPWESGTSLLDLWENMEINVILYKKKTELWPKTSRHLLAESPKLANLHRSWNLDGIHRISLDWLISTSHIVAYNLNSKLRFCQSPKFHKLAMTWKLNPREFQCVWRPECHLFESMALVRPPISPTNGLLVRQPQILPVAVTLIGGWTNAQFVGLMRGRTNEQLSSFLVP